MRSLIIAENFPSETYGSGQRLLAIQTSLRALGECRTVWIRPMNSDEKPHQADYFIAGNVPLDAGRVWWVWHQLTFKDYRADARLVREVEAIRADYPFDIVFCSFFRTQPAAPHGVVPCFLDADAIPLPDSRLRSLLWPLTRRMMQRATARFETVFVIRATDAEIIDPKGRRTVFLPGTSATATAPIAVNPNAVNILFVGSMGWGPNRLAADYLVNYVAPSIPPGSDFKVRLVGSGTDEYQELINVEGVGYVSDIEDEYRNAKVVVCPIWSGGGANIKLAEAVQYGCAVVASAHAASAFGDIFKAGENIVIAHDESGFSSQLFALLADTGALESLRRHAKQTGLERLSQASLNAIISAEIRSVPLLSSHLT